MADKEPSIGDKILDTFGRLTDRAAEAIGLKYKAPSMEPELLDLVQIKQKGDMYEVRVIANNQVTTMSHKQFNKFVYSKNIEILTRKREPFAVVVAKYNFEIQRIKARNAGAVRRAESHDDTREALAKRIEVMLANWEVEFRNRRNSQQAKDARERIHQLQRQLSTMKPKGIDEYLEGTFTKYSFDVEVLVRLSNNYAKTGNPITLTPKEEQWIGNGEDLVKIYEKEIDFIEDHYLDDINERLAANQAYLAK